MVPAARLASHRSGGIPAAVTSPVGASALGGELGVAVAVAGAGHQGGQREEAHA